MNNSAARYKHGRGRQRSGHFECPLSRSGNLNVNSTVQMQFATDSADKSAIRVIKLGRNQKLNVQSNRICESANLKTLLLTIINTT